MRSIKFFTGACALALSMFAATNLAVTNDALAADLGGPRESMKDGPAYEAPALPWTGPYVGMQLGYAWAEARHSFFDVGGFLGGPDPANSDPDGFIGGSHIGYNFQRGSIVYGIEADIEWGDVSGSYVDLSGATSTGAVEMNWQGSLRARLGVVSGSALFYVTGGWAFGDFDFSGGPAFGFVCCGYSETRSGWTVGGGAEWMIARNLTARVEYRYTDYGEASGGLAPFFPEVIMPVELEIHAVRGGLSYRF